MAISFARPARFAPSHAVAAARPSSPPHNRQAGAATRAGADRMALGVVAILGSTLSFPLSDLAAQSLMPALPPIEVAWLRYLVFVLAALPFLARGRRATATARPGLQVLRGAMSACSTLAAITAFKFLPVPETTAISFVAPVIVTALALVFLGERVGIRRWVAALAALVGVLVIVQPGGATFRPAALIPLAGAFANATAVIATRLNNRDSAGTTMLYSATVGAVILSVLVCFEWKTPTVAELPAILIVGVFGALGTLFQVMAYRFAPASLLAPFTSTQLIWAGAFSFLLLGTIPSIGMMVGGGIIAASAIYTANRERVRGVG